MARNAAPRRNVDGTPSDDPAQDEGATPPPDAPMLSQEGAAPVFDEDGNALGVPRVGDTLAETRVVRREDHVTGDARDPRSEAAPQHRQYEVVSGGTLMQNGFPYVLRPGKRISEAHFDIKALRRQGIRLVLVDDTVEE